MGERQQIHKLFRRPQSVKAAETPSHAPNVIEGPVVDPLGRAWANGKIPGEVYFSTVWERARKLSAEDVSRRLKA